MTEPVTYLDPLQGSSKKEQRARVRLGSLAVPTAAWWTQTKQHFQPQDIKKKDITKSTSQPCVVTCRLQKMLHGRQHRRSNWPIDVGCVYDKN